MSWSLACRDWEARLREGRSLVPTLPLFERNAARAVKIFNMLRLPDVIGTPAMADAAGDWFRDIVAALFGSLDPATNERHIRELLTLVPKKNSKTTNGAGMMMTALLMNERPRAEFLMVGPTQAIADTGFSQAIGMIEADDAWQRQEDGKEGYLKKRFRVREHIKEIKDLLNGAKLKIKTFDTKVMTGVKPVGALVDELHELGSIPDAERVVGQIRGGIIPNPEGFLAFITTQSEKPPAGIFKAELEKARAIRDGRVNGVMLPVLYEFPTAMVKSGEWENSANWPMVTPNRDRSITIERLVQDYETARTTSIGELRRWASQHLNIEIGLALQSDSWPGAEFWEAAGQASLTLDSLLERSEVVVVGIDGGGLDDLLGLTVLGREKKTGKWLAWSRAWAHRIVLERRKDVSSRLRDFEADGHLTIVGRPGLDVDAVADIVLQIESAGLLAEKHAIAVDSVGIGDIVDALTDEAHGISAERIVGISQGWKLNGAIKTTERKVAGGDLQHDGSPMMAWCVGNAKAEARGNAISITKQAAGSAKIDPLMSLFNAVSLMATNPEPAGRSFWAADDAVERLSA